MRRMGVVVLAVMVGVGLACSSARAQEKALETYVPDGAVLYVYYQGLAKASTTFEGTALKKIASEPEVQAFGTELLRFIGALMAEDGGRAGVTVGDVRMLADCEAAFAVTDAKGRRPGVMVVVRPGKHADALRKLVDREMTRDGGAEVVEGQVGGVKYKEIGKSCLAWVGSDLVVTSTRTGMGRVAAASAGTQPSLAQDAQFKAICARTTRGKAFLMVHFDVDELVRQAMPAGRGRGDRKMLAALGFDCVSSVHLSVAPQAPGVRSSVYIHTPAGPKGLIKILPSRPMDEKKLLGRVPRGAEGFLAARWSAADAFDAIVGAVAAAEGEEDFAGVLEAMKETLGFHLRDDLFAALGDEIVLLDYNDDPAGMPAPCFVISVRDEAAVKRCLEKLEQAAKRWPAPEEELIAQRFPQPQFRFHKQTHKGHDVYVIDFSLGMMPIQYTLSLAVHNRRLIIGVGAGAAITAIDAPEAPAQSIAADSEFARLRPRLSPQVAMVSYYDAREVFKQVHQIARVMLPTLLRAARDVPENTLVEKLPRVETVVPHLFGSITAVGYDGQGFLVESYGPAGGMLNPSSGVAFAGIGAGFMLPALAKAQEAARRTSCMNNIRQIGLALMQYAGEHDGEFPKDLSVLLQKGYLTTPKVFVCPSSGVELPDDLPADARNITAEQLAKFNCYVLVPGARSSWNANAIIVYEKDNHDGQGRNIWFNDGQVKWHSEADFQRMMQEQKAQMRELE